MFRFALYFFQIERPNAPFKNWLCINVSFKCWPVPALQYLNNPTEFKTVITDGRSHITEPITIFN